MTGLNKLPAMFALIVFSLMNTQVCARTSEDLQYNVFLDGDKIGSHRVIIKPEASSKIVEVEANFQVKFLFFNAYEYQHSAREEWNDNCLSKISTSTDDNGSQLFVDGQRQSDAFRIETPKGIATVNGCVKSFAYWDPQLLQASHLLNTQTGEYVAVKTLMLNEEEISLGNSKVKARHYQIISDQFVIDLWYSADKDWLALSTTTENGANLRYERR